MIFTSFLKQFFYLNKQQAMTESPDKHRQEKEEMCTTRNTLLLEFNASSCCLQQNNPIIHQVTGVQAKRVAQFTSR